MSIFFLLPMIAFSLLFLFLIAQHDEKVLGGKNNLNWQESLIQTAIFWSSFFAVSTEFLSLVRGLTTFGILTIWSFALLALGILLWRNRTFQKGWERIKQGFTVECLGWFELFLLAIILITLMILLITGVISPPNIHDVLTYHMSRVMHWAQNRSLVFFPTSITWQLYYPPFSEFSQLHWQVLVGSDTLSAFHQWYSLVFILIVVAAIAKRFGAKQKGQLLSALFILSLPIVVLQASNGKNDIVLTFFFMAFTYHVVKAAYQPLSLMDFISAGLAFGLGIFTKGNFLFFSIPMLIWLLIVMLRKAGWKKSLIFFLIGLVSVVGLNGAHWFRTTMTFGDPLNTGEADFIMNARFGVDVLISNLARNMALQLASVSSINPFVQVLLTRLHNFMGIPLFDSDITLGPSEFLYMPTREEIAGNPVHFGITGLVLIGLILVARKNKNRPDIWPPLFLTFVAIGGMVLFSGVFRWQAWGTRYFIFYYALFATVIGYLVNSKLPRWVSWLLSLLLVIAMVNPLFNNYSRSFSWSETNRNSIWRMSRKGLRFANHQIYEGAILELTHLMDISGCRTYGMSIGGNSPEYLIWGTLVPHPFDYYLEHMAVNNPSSVHETENFNPCGIIVFESAPPEEAKQGDYEFLKGWQLSGYEGYPLTLYMKPDVIPRSLE